MSSALQHKYELLCRKYEAVVRKYERAGRAALGVVRLGSWALQASASGLALVRRGTIELSNFRWQELERNAGDGWERLQAVAGERQKLHSLREIALREAREQLSAREPVSRITRYRRAASQQVVEIRSERLDADEEVVAILAHDVTDEARSAAELRTAREALHHRDRLQVIGQVASGVAHDLNNALNVMRLRLELLRRSTGDRSERDAQVAAFAQIVDAAAARVARMHDLSRKHLEGAVEPVDLRSAIEAAIALARTQFEQHSVIEGRRFRIAFEMPELPPVRADLAELEHLFVNLLLNARDAMPNGGTVSIAARRDGDYAEVTVQDEGTGIPEENLERIFESFFTTKGKQGTGLGLAMARSTMVRLGGTIGARNVDRGAQFVLRFPLSLEPPRAGSRRVLRPREASFRQLRILLVDDDADCLEVTRAVLEAERLAVDTALTGAEAIAMLQRRKYDVLLCDVGMPGMSGWQVAQEARRLRPALPIYMVTGWAAEFPGDDPRRQGVSGVLGKPLVLDDLRAALRAIGPSPQPVHDQANA